VPAVAGDDQAYRDFSIDPHESLISELGIFGKTVNSRLALLNGLRSKAGIYVVATTASNEHSGLGLATGDVVVSLNGVPIQNMQELRGAIHEVTGRKPAVVQIERSGRFLYIEREMEERPSDSITDRGGKAVSTNWTGLRQALSGQGIGRSYNGRAPRREPSGGGGDSKSARVPVLDASMSIAYRGPRPALTRGVEGPLPGKSLRAR
jgi:hypothetical protein